MDAWCDTYRQLIRAKSGPCLTGSLGCLIWHGQTKSKYGIQQVSWFPGDELRPPRMRRMYAHRVAYIVAYGKELTPKHDISHLCHEPLCVEISHLSSEPHSINNNRQHCKNIGRCLGHSGYAPCIFVN